MVFVDSDMEDDSQSGSEEDMSNQSDDLEEEDDDDDDQSVSEVVEVSDDEVKLDSDENEDGNMENEVEESRKDKKKKRKRPMNKKDKKKISSEEAKDLRDKEHTYSSNLYRVQIEELLKEISLTDKIQKEAQKWFIDFRNYLLSCKPSKPHAITDFEVLLKGIPLPLPADITVLEDSNEKITWVQPSEIVMIGSWQIQAAVNKISCVDIALELPMEFYRKKDFLNHRYHIKRAIYLAYLARLLSERGDVVQFTLQQGNPTKPALLITCSHFKVKIITSVSKLFKASRFSPTINNLRFNHYFQHQQKALPDNEPEVATPNYNFSILTDVLILDSQTSVHSVLRSCESYTNATKLIKVWLHQRGIDKGYGGFTGFIASAFIVYLSLTEKIDRLMTSYDVLRTFFSNLAHLDLTSNGIGLFCANNPSDISIADWHLQFDVVFLDSSGKLNYTADMSEFTFKRVQREAQRAVEILGRNKIEGVQALFLTPVLFIRNFDHILQLKSCDIQTLLKDGKEQLFLNHSGFQYPIIISVFGPIIEQCLGARVQLVDNELIPDPVWSIFSKPPNANNNVVRFGFVINRDTAYKLIEKCDAENSFRVKSFKDLWGDKSHLRRFKDGTMCETVVFEDKHQLLYQMLSYIFQAQFDLKSEMPGLSYFDCQVENVVEKDFNVTKKLTKPKQVTYVKGKRKKSSVTDFQQLVPRQLDTICSDASLVFDDLSKVLRSLEGLPLEVSSVQGTSSILRFTSVHPTPAQHFQSSKCWGGIIPTRVNGKIMTLNKEHALSKVPKVVEPISVVLHLETSGKWPDDVEAVDRLKCAFLTRIGKLLTDQFGLTVQIYPRCLDVEKDGFIFRIKLTHYRELIMLKQRLGVDGVLKVRDSAESMRLEKETLLLPQLTTTLHSFCRQFEAFGKTVRLAKRWIASQLLLASPLKYGSIGDHPDCRFTEECVELLVAHIFMSFSPYLSHPNEAQVGFLRFLSLLSSCDWKSTPFVLNFHDKLSKEELSAIELDFVRRRSQLPLLFIVTPEDTCTSVWTKHLAPVFLYRIQLLATEALSILETCWKSDTLDYMTQIKKVFRTDTQEFDILIHLKKSMNPHSCDNIDAKNAAQFHEYVKSAKVSLPIIDFDPVQTYLSELRRSFGHVALFLHNTFGGSVIAVVWKPESFKEQDFAVSTINAKRIFEETSVVPDVDEIIESFEILGQGLVENIERLS